MMQRRVVLTFFRYLSENTRYTYGENNEKRNETEKFLSHPSDGTGSVSNTDIRIKISVRRNDSAKVIIKPDLFRAVSFEMNFVKRWTYDNITPVITGIDEITVIKERVSQFPGLNLNSDSNRPDKNGELSLKKDTIIKGRIRQNSKHGRPVNSLKSANAIFLNILHIILFK
jgi:hypothetical protein